MMFKSHRSQRSLATIGTQDPLALAAVGGIHRGDIPRLKRLLAENPDLATASLGDEDPDGMSRTLRTSRPNRPIASPAARRP
jgi:hypothetical protein